MTGWARAIALGLRATSVPAVSLVELSKRLGMPWIEVWLGVLLGGFELEQRGEFYHSPIWVGRSEKVPDVQPLNGCDRPTVGQLLCNTVIIK